MLLYYYTYTISILYLYYTYTIPILLHHLIVPRLHHLYTVDTLCYSMVHDSMIAVCRVCSTPLITDKNPVRRPFTHYQLLILPYSSTCVLSHVTDRTMSNEGGWLFCETATNLSID
ncbi:hypothetical protein HYPBUDRAFT_225561 [Hyphopichia burtonii NRRL Y-1933]|uniref:Uncharacterized protein n=1 Tax=Hyphopichia burtonii NRRL Y-1933 TaxID=984485 RepID=A0A1E4RDU7_9ASCO|nr:hypothetical protein HYPBUDRAFT_225561 [Hyphopichia burtonii NRRL Y-1933]ODV65449.1 hypothetical protein HYPBUDRAFT_225561 [Hyphopichia burtonii NRRL Y-1933]